MTPRDSVGGGEQERGLRFEVDAALLFELGEKLVARKSVALAELIKNAYDADATEVVVTFEDVTKPGGTITIQDNGHGMTLETVRRAWMRIATDEKVRHPVSPRYGRYRTGAKGVGRFAARRLAEHLTLRTAARIDESTWEEVVVEFDWKRFRHGADLRTIGNRYRRRRSSEPLPTGVRMILRRARDVWTAEDFRELRGDLDKFVLMSDAPACASARLAAAGQYEKDPGFSISFVAPEFPEYEGELSEQFLETAWGKLMGYVEEGGTPVYRLRVRGEEAEYTFRPANEEFPELVGAECVIHYFIYSKEYFTGVPMGVRAAQRLGRSFGGVRIYLDRFRVSPYGDPGDDWLSLDEDRARRLTWVPPVLRGLLEEDLGESRPMLSLPGNNQLFGRVLVSRAAHPDIMLTLARERLIENDAFRQLKRFVRLGIDWMTVQRARIEQEEQRRKSAAATARRREHVATTAEIVTSVVTRLKKELETTSPPEKASELSEALDRLETAVRAEEQKHIGKVAMLRVLASVGTMVVVFVHEVRSVLDHLVGLVRDLEDSALSAGAGPPGELSERLRFDTQVLEAQADLIGFLLGSETRRRRVDLALHPIVERLGATLAGYCRDNGIKIINAVPKYLRTPPMYQAELHSLLLNLLTNALKAVKAEPERLIEVSAEDDGACFCMFVKDTGHGIAPEDRERVFEPFVTTSQPDPVLGVGTGLGLTIVRDIVSEHNGRVRFVDAEPPWRTCVQVEIPRGLGG